MLSKNVLFLLLLTALAKTNAATIEQLAKKNNDLLDLKADLAIAETRDKLKKLNAPTAPTSLSLGGVAAPFPAPKAVAKQKSVSADIDDIDFIGAGGDVSSPVGKFAVGSSFVMKRAGDVLNGWSIVKISATEVVLSKQFKKETVEKSIYLASRNRLTEPRNAPATQQTASGSVLVPAIQPPLK